MVEPGGLIRTHSHHAEDLLQTSSKFMDAILYFPRHSQKLLDRGIAPLSNSASGLHENNEIRSTAMEKASF